MFGVATNLSLAVHIVHCTSSGKVSEWFSFLSMIRCFIAKSKCVAYETSVGLSFGITTMLTLEPKIKK